MNDVANDVVYHNLCWVNAKCIAEPNAKPTILLSKTLGITLINFIETHIIHTPEKVLVMNTANPIYFSIMVDNRKIQGQLSTHYKKYLKNLVQESITGITFVKNTQKNKPHHLMSEITQSEDVNIHSETVADKNDGLCFLIMSHARFRVNLHSAVA